MVNLCTEVAVETGASIWFFRVRAFTRAGNTFPFRMAAIDGKTRLGKASRADAALACIDLSAKVTVIAGCAIGFDGVGA